MADKALMTVVAAYVGCNMSVLETGEAIEVIDSPTNKAIFFMGYQAGNEV